MPHDVEAWLREELAITKAILEKPHIKADKYALGYYRGHADACARALVRFDKARASEPTESEAGK